MSCAHEPMDVPLIACHRALLYKYRSPPSFMAMHATNRNRSGRVNAAFSRHLRLRRARHGQEKIPPTPQRGLLGSIVDKLNEPLTNTLTEQDHHPTLADRAFLPTDDGARCLDGSPPAIYVSKGDPDRWFIYHQGGGWCTSMQACCEKAAMKGCGGTPSDSPSGDLTSLGGYFNRDPASNPLMHDWSFAFLP